MIYRVGRSRPTCVSDMSWAQKALAKSQHPNTIIAVGEDVGRAIRALENKALLSVDTEFFGCDIRTEHPFGLARVGCAQITGSKLDGSDRVSVFIPNWREYQGTIREFKRTLESSQPRIIGHNVKVDMHALANEGVTIPDIKADTMVMDYLHVNGELVMHGLKECSRRYFGKTEADEYDKVFRTPIPKKNGEPSKRMRVMPVDEVLQTEEGILKMFNYSMKDPSMTLDLYLYLEEKLRKIEWTKTRDYFEYYNWLDRAYTSVLFRIERRGCFINQDKLAILSDQVDAAIEAAKIDFFSTCVDLGISQKFLDGFNMASPKQLGELFESKLGIELPRTEKGAASTGKEVLEGISDAKGRLVASKLLRVRTIEKLKSTYIEAFKVLVARYGGKLHTEYKQIGAVTGRLSSSKPNLQNIANNEEFNIRELFEADLLAFDEEVEYGGIDASQIEMRITAHFTQEPTLLSAIRNKMDLHSLTAFRTFHEIKKVFGVDSAITRELLEKVAKQFPKLRKAAKTINFGIIYGLGPQGYACKQGCSEEQAKRVIQNYFRAFPLLKQGIEDARNYARKHGYIRTLLGRYLYLSNINSSNNALRAQDERRAFNYKVQGSSADLIKMSMVLIDQDKDLEHMGVQMILQVHDELGLNIPTRVKVKAKERVELHMSKPLEEFGFKPMRIETPADMGFGKNWSIAKKAA